MAETELAGLQIAILLADGVEEHELEAATERLRLAGAEVTSVGIQEGWIQALIGWDPGHRFRIQKSIEEASSAQYDALVIPGGYWSTDALRTNARALALIREFESEQKPICFLGQSAALMISCGLMRGRTVASRPAIADDIVNAGGRWMNLAVVTDQNWISGRAADSTDIHQFLREAVGNLARHTPPIIQVSESA